MKRLLNSAFWAMTLLVSAAVLAVGQTNLETEQFRVFTGDGEKVLLTDVVKRSAAYEVIFLGENHDDTIGHAVQLEIFRQLLTDHHSDREIALSLEMFERDVQIVLDEYLSGLITEPHFLSSSRPWANYKTDYRPLVELAKEKRISVIAANAPRRYINMVSRNGREALSKLSDKAKAALPPLPFAEPSEAYSAKFKGLMGKSPEANMGIDRILASQSLWDASMAYSVATFLRSTKKPLVIHLNGSFHTENRLGTVEHLMKYRPKTKALVVTIRYEDDFESFDKVKHGGIGDFVVLTKRQKKETPAVKQP